MLPYLQVAKTLTVADGMGRAFCRVHCNKPPKRKHIFNDPHFAQHWTHEGDNLWTFATESHSVKVHFTAERKLLVVACTEPSADSSVF